MICAGLVSHFLGMLATTLSRWEEAEQCFIDALALGTKLAAKPFLADTQHQYAQMLLARGQPSDHEETRGLLDQALATAQELGMKSLEEKVQSLKSQVQRREDVQSSRVRSQEPRVRRGAANGKRQKTEFAPQSADARLWTLDDSPNTQRAVRSVLHAIFRYEGAYWTLTYQNQVCRLKDAKGLHYLAALLRSPGREFHVVDLSALTDFRPPAHFDLSWEKFREKQLVAQHLHVSAQSDAGASLDPQAKAAYKRRLEELRDEQEEAQRFNDLGRAAKIQEEIDFLTAELSAAYGLGGRARKSAVPSEKFRQAVTQCLRRTLTQIQRAHPALGRHLRAALKTGAFCSYQPEHPTFWEV